MAPRIPDIIKAHAPSLSPRTWYGIPAYALEGCVICFLQSAQKFKTRYATLGFSDKANVDDGRMANCLRHQRTHARRRGSDLNPD